MRLITFALALACVAVFPALAQDPVKLNPEQYNVIADNDLMRVLRVIRKPGEVAKMHTHPNPAVVIFVKDMNQRITNPGAEPREVHRKAGQISFNKPGNQHEEATIGDAAMESVLVEIKPATVNGVDTPISPEFDIAKASPDTVTVEVDNELVRVLRVKRGPGAKTPMHEHPNYVAVFLTDVHQSITGADGNTRESKRKRGDVAINKPAKHSEVGMSSQPSEVIVVELKKAPKGA